MNFDLDKWEGAGLKTWVAGRLEHKPEAVRSS